MYKDKKVLLIAGGGTLGTYVSKELNAKGCYVDVLCMEDKVSDNEYLSFIKANVDNDYLRAFLKDKHYDGIVNFLHYEDEKEYMEIYPTLQKATDHLIFLSSYRVYADEVHPITEDAPRLLDVVDDEEFINGDTYANPKAKCEDFLRNEHKGENWTIVRPVISFSDKRLDMLLYSGKHMLRMGLRQEEVIMPETVRNLKAGIDWAGNSGKLIANLLFKKDAIGEAFTIYSGHGLTWEGVANAYQKETGVKFKWVSEEEYLEKTGILKTHKLMWHYDRKYNRDIDASKVLKVTGLNKDDFASVDEGIRTECDIILNNRVKIAQIGVNMHSHATDIFNTLKILPEMYELVGYALVEDERETCKHKLGAFEGYKEMAVDDILNDPTIDAVAIETDEVHLFKYALMAAKHNKHIHMEKPGSQDIDAFREIVKIMKENNKILHLGYMYRYNPFIKEAIKDIREGKYGEIFSVEAHMSRFDNDDVVEWLGNFKGGMMFYLGCHLIDLVMQIQGEPDEISTFNCSTNPDTFNTDDYAMAVFKYRNGVSFVKTTASEVGGFERRQLVVCGKKGTLVIEPLEISAPNGRYDFFTDRREIAPGAPKGKVRSRRYQRYIDMIISFNKMVKGEITNPYTYEYEIKLLETILKCCDVK